MNLRDLAARKNQVMTAAAIRWETKACEVLNTETRLGRVGRLAATSDLMGKEFLSREVLKPRPTSESFLYERKIGPTLDFVDLAPNALAERAGRPVARIVELVGGDRLGEGFATGFLISPGVLVTNWHVFPEESSASNCAGQFGYEKNRAGSIDSGVVFAIDPSIFFLSDQTLDVAIVGIRRTAIFGRGAIDDFGTIKLVPVKGKYLVGNPINIIQHPDGMPKRWAISENGLRVEPTDEDLFLNYLTDTLGGSSGSPAFNHDWEMVAVHHSGVPRRVNENIMTKSNSIWREGMPDDDIDWVANEGVRVSKVCTFLSGIKLPNLAKQSILSRILSGVAVSSGIEDKWDTPSSNPDSQAKVTADILEPARAVSIIVNGTANFYIASEEGNATSDRASFDSVTKVVATEKKLRFDSDYENRPGYSSEFLDGFDIPLPSAPTGELLKKGNRAMVLDYHHFSLVMHKKRRLAMWTASNVDFSENLRRKTREEFGADTWKPDPRIPIEAQIEDLEFYAPAAKFDRGHLVRRDDVAWGNDEQEEEYGNSDSFHWTNCTPQHEGFNRDMFGYHGIWGQLENYITMQATFVEKKYVLFSGPVLDHQNDPIRDFGSGIDVQIPIGFWKVVVVVERMYQETNLRAYGFLMDQADAIEEYGWEGRFRASRFRERQVSLVELTKCARVEFDEVLHRADPLANLPTESKSRALMSLQDIVLR